MHSLKCRIVVASLVSFLMTGLSTATVTQVAVAQSPEAGAGDGFNDQYVFATTKSVTRMDNVNPALKLTLFPVTVVLDTVFLPFAIVAGYVA
jgi:uncharacterized protein YceK